MLNDVQLSSLRKVQSLCLRTAVYPGMDQPTGRMYAALGVAGEAGECAELVKKLWRNHDGVPSDAWQIKMAGEIGDVVWYLSALAHECGLTLDECVEMMLAKLQQRKLDGALKHE